jgi:hypothetical protein
MSKRMSEKASHHVESFREDGTRSYGWQCFTCEAERKGFRLVAEAESDALSHENEAIIRNEITLLLIHHLADTGLTPTPDELSDRYAILIEDLSDLMMSARKDSVPT